ncbi:MAG: hypothetical protein HY860_01260 [Chlamydiales bacterium]|nr:hypothetical protein [Chlamydiales bacterium]
MEVTSASLFAPFSLDPKAVKFKNKDKHPMDGRITIILPYKNQYLLHASCQGRSVGRAEFHEEIEIIRIAWLENTTIGTAIRVYEVGTRMMELIISFAKHRNKNIRLFAKNAVPFYLSFGFHVVKYAYLEKLTRALQGLLNGHRSLDDVQDIYLGLRILSKEIERSVSITDTDIIREHWFWDNVGPIVDDQMSERMKEEEEKAEEERRSPSFLLGDEKWQVDMMLPLKIVIEEREG